MNYVTNLLQGLVPLFAASIVFILLAAKFRGTFQKFRDGDASTITLALVTVLCASYGVERLVNASRLDQRLTSIEEQISKSSGVRLLDNYNERVMTR
jgi:hypothetical protein